jgi:hypothetical protein
MRESIKTAPKKNGRPVKKAGSASALSEALAVGATASAEAVARAGDYKDQIYNYLYSIRPRTSTLEALYEKVDPPATDDLRQRAVKDDLGHLIAVEKKVVEVSLDVYLAVTF